MKKINRDTLLSFSNRFSYSGYVFTIVGLPIIFMSLFGFNCPYILSNILLAFLMAGIFFVLLGLVFDFLFNCGGDSND